MEGRHKLGDRLMPQFKRFEHRRCEHWPCHGDNPVNCIFCFCPLYDCPDCGGHYSTLANGLKDCSECGLPHGEDGYDIIVESIKQKHPKQVQ